ncbi:MAG: cupin domain-containing protein [Patescibacteria group bacterium]|jgi:mannose-6-phosphate isomerase-like protein (cupin superfamily)
MIIRDSSNLQEFIGGDQTILCEFFNANTEKLPLRYSLAHAIVKPGNRSTRHRMKTSEVYYILSGTGRIHIDNEVAVVHEGQAVIVPPRATQWVENTGTDDLEFLCIVDPAWKQEDEEIL